MPHFEGALGIDEIANRLYERLMAVRERHAKDESHRILVAVAGVPGSGKSTITAALAEVYLRKQKQRLAIFPMVHFFFSTLRMKALAYMTEGRFPLFKIQASNIPRSGTGFSSTRSCIHFRCRCLPETGAPAKKDIGY